MFRNRFDIFARFNTDDPPQGGDPGNSSDPGAGSSGGNSGNGQGSDPAAAFQRRLKEYDNDAMQFASKLFDENYTYRARARQLQQEIDSLKTKALSDDDLQALETYKALGDPETVKQGLTEREELQGKLAGLERAEQIRSVAESAGYKPSVLAKLDATARAEGKELAFELRDVEQDGATVKQAYVKDGEAEHALTEYAAREWADFLPALAVTPAEGGGNSSRATGTPHPSQQATGGGSRPETTKAVAESYISKTYRSANNGSNRN